MSDIRTEMHPEPSHDVGEEWMDDGVREVSTQYSILFETREMNPEQ